MPTSTSAIDGKQIKHLRLKELKQTQPQFAQWLSTNTGEAITSRAVCRMENYGEADACNPLTPSAAVVELVSTHLGNSSKKKVVSPKGSDAQYRNQGHANPGFAIANPNRGDSEEALNMTKKKLIRKVIADYRELGLPEAEGDTAVEMIQSIESNIRDAERELVGHTNELESLKKELEQLSQEELEIDSELLGIDDELEQVEAQLTSLNGSQTGSSLGLGAKKRA